ncbi:PEP-CTERM sorting domain-containing protein [uncultured Roseobacter sp.]|uniref:PEP-CTERM sorting domain-containing protein n=1 Tax=uncultured Roseobacter sp. TaxID=114847 RepID=UPI00260571CB|nr:PEP-CTERM sorting domain-containing protein [uncultured Roseobacter sp.]
MRFDMMKAGAVAVTLTVGSLFGAEAQAATQYEGLYDATSVTTGSNDHSVWLPNLFNGASAYWQFAPDAGSLAVASGNSTADLTGTIQNNSVSNYQMNVDVSYALRNPNVPGDKVKTGGGNYDGTWSFFDIVSATLTGIGDLAGLTLTLSAFPDPLKEDIPFQLGEGANDKNAGLGASGWFSWTAAVDSSYTGPSAFASAQGKHGDINVNLALDDDGNNPSPVPVPGAGLLMLAGLGGLGAMRMRKRKN